MRTKVNTFLDKRLHNSQLNILNKLAKETKIREKELYIKKSLSNQSTDFWKFLENLPAFTWKGMWFPVTFITFFSTLVYYFYEMSVSVELNWILVK